ncbi:prolyl oligopeptidase family serine peptidase [Streptomyces sp. NPDC050560]|uniref:prolyl oligopeptidase family serine peptidase n=1 Tax=Streptomyces sp. NPDC050560 TaxID=3365630 RepID=UPI0037947820
MTTEEPAKAPCTPATPTMPAAPGAEARAAFPRQFARTRRFTLGGPERFTVSPDGARVLFTRSESGTDPFVRLWRHDTAADTEHPLTPPPARRGATGVSSYATDRAVRTAAYVADGLLYTVAADGGGAPARLPTAGRATDPRPSPDGSLVAYASGGSLYVVGADGSGGRALAVAPGPGIAYGTTDHVAHESIGRTRAYWWSPGGDALLVARADTTGVRRRHIADPTDPGRPPTALPYPAAGTPNAVTTLHLITTGGRRVPVDLPDADTARPAPEPGVWHAPGFDYLVAAAWDGERPVVTLQTRDQRTALVLAVDPETGAVEPLHRLTDDAWVHLPPGAPLMTAAGTAVLPHPHGDTRGISVGGAVSPAGLDVRAVLGAVGERVYFTASEEPTETHVWCHGPGTGFTRLTAEPGVHTAAAGGDTLVVDSRRAHTGGGRRVTVRGPGGAEGRVRILTDAPLVTPRPVMTALGERALRARLHLPSWYEPGSGRRLPVLLSPYGGPGLQMVNRAGGWPEAVAQWFAEHGFAVLATDGRGTPGRGVAWLRAVLGDRLTPVLDDQVDALRAAAARYDALDLGRVGIRGWSYGGYLAAGAVLRRPDVFHAAVAGAAPTDRRLYDTYWEERYLGHPGHQPHRLPGVPGLPDGDGYERSSLLADAPRLRRPLMLVHGLADDNVHLAHTLRLSAALLAAGRPHTVLPLPRTGHLVTTEGTADTLLRAELRFLTDALGAEIF